MENNNATPEIQQTGIPQFTSESILYVYKVAKWGKFLAILGFIIAGFLFAGGIAMSFVLSMVKDDMIPLNMPVSPNLLSVFYILVAGVYIIPNLYLNSFSNNVMKAVKSGNSANMTTALKNLKKLFAFIGITTILILSLYTLTLITIGVAAILSL